MYSLVYVEIVRGCNLACEFCPHSLENNEIHMMEMSTVDTIVEHLRKADRKIRLSLSGRGEPTLHPQFIEIVRKFASIPKVRVICITNGARLSQQWIDDVYAAGMRGLHIDVYNAKTDAAAHAIDYPVPCFYIQDGNIWSNSRPCVVVCDEREERYNSVRAFHNWAGAARKEYWTGDIPRQSPCSSPLKMITVRWDGKYAVCCSQWLDEVTFGTVFEEDFDQQYNRKDRMDLCNTIMHTGGRKDTVSCRYCNVKSPRAHVWRRALRERGYDI